MQDNTRRNYPGQTTISFHSAVAAPPRLADEVDIPEPKTASPQPQPRPQAATAPAKPQGPQGAKTAPQKPQADPANRNYNPVLPGPVAGVASWISALFSINNKKNITPAERIFFFGCGVALLVADAFLSQLFVQRHFPQTANHQTGLALFIGLVIMGIPTVVQLFFWKGGHDTIFGLFMLATLGLNFWINVEGVMQLFGVTTVQADAAGALIIGGAGFIALFAERFLVRSWRG